MFCYYCGKEADEVVHHEVLTLNDDGSCEDFYYDVGDTCQYCHDYGKWTDSEISWDNGNIVEISVKNNLLILKNDAIGLTMKSYQFCSTMIYSKYEN